MLNCDCCGAANASPATRRGLGVAALAERHCWPGRERRPSSILANGLAGSRRADVLLGTFSLDKCGSLCSFIIPRELAHQRRGPACLSLRVRCCCCWRGNRPKIAAETICMDPASAQTVDCGHTRSLWTAGRGHGARAGSIQRHHHHLFMPLVPGHTASLVDAAHGEQPFSMCMCVCRVQRMTKTCMLL